MKLTLKNFKCYEEEHVFDLGDTGLTLISGVSGSGKSTILSAIIFVLYGTGKIQTFGQKTCFVELIFDNMTITRTKRPNRVVFNDVFEDDAAQECINKFFGKNFSIMSYISQSHLNSFVFMSPSNKLDFLETFAFNDINLQNIKEKCKNIIKEREEKLSISCTELEVHKRLLEEHKIPIEIPFPIAGKTKLTDLSIKNEETRLKNCNKNLTNLYKKKEKLVKELNDINLLNASIKPKKENIYRNDIKLETIQKKYNDFVITDIIISISNNKLLISNIKKKKDFILKQEKLLRDSENIEILKNKELDEYKYKLNAYITIWDEYTKEEANNTLNELKKCLPDSKQLFVLKSKCDEHIVNNDDILLDTTNLDKKIQESVNLDYNINKIKEKIKTDSIKLENKNNLYILKEQKKLNYIDPILLDNDINQLVSIVEYQKIFEENRIFLQEFTTLDDNIQKLEKLKKSKNCYTCPFCNTTLSIEFNKLVLIDRINLNTSVGGEYITPQESVNLDNTILSLESNIHEQRIFYSKYNENIIKLQKINSDLCIKQGVSTIDFSSIIENSISILNMKESILSRQNKKIIYEKISEKIYELEQLITPIDDLELYTCSTNSLEEMKKNIIDFGINLLKIGSDIKILERNIFIKNNSKNIHEENILLIKEIESKYEEIPTVENITEDILYLMNYIKKNEEKEKNKQLLQLKITNNIFSNSLTSLENDIRNRKINMDSNLEIFTEFSEIIETLSTDNIIDNINISERLLEDIKNNQEIYKQITKENKNLDEEINNQINNHVDVYTIVNLSTFLENTLIDIVNEIKISEKKKDEHQIVLQNISKYQEYLNTKKEYNSKILTIKNIENNVIIDRKKYGSSMLYKEKIAQAESISLSNIINSINTHAQLYLNIFFTDNPIAVRLVSFKESKNIKIENKPQINIEISYKGMENIVFNDLSGGELARLNIAFTLAFSEIFNSPLIMLDESMSSLDEVHSSQVIEGIKENFNGKICIIVAHQTIEGMYDNIIHL